MSGDTATATRDGVLAEGDGDGQDTYLAALSDADLCAQLRESYGPTVVPPCRVCGGKLGLASVGGGRPTVWACPEPRTAEDEMDWEHYNRSRWDDYRCGGDSRVIELMRRYQETKQ